MVSQEFVKRMSGKVVHIDFYDENGNIDWCEGILSEVEIIDNGKDDLEEFIEIESETDLDRINMKQVKKIYLKEKKE